MNSSVERQLTHAPYGHLLTNAGTWSADGQWIVYDIRSTADGSDFNGTRIERVNTKSGRVEILYQSQADACCGVVTASPTDDRIVFIHGPENPTSDWTYNACHRRGVIVRMDDPETAITLDARDLTPPFTAGALRGGSHVHTFSPDGKWIAFTYEDHLLWTLGDSGTHDVNQRGIGISVPAGPVVVGRGHARNHDGSHFTVLVTRTANHPIPGSDEISRAFEDGWVGLDGYLRLDGKRQHRAIAFQGQVVTAEGESVSEAFIVDLPEDLTREQGAPLEGTATTRPAPPDGVVQRRLTFTSDRKHPGIQGVRHWLRSSPDGTQIAFLMKDDQGIVQLWTVSPNGGSPKQLTDNPNDIASAFTWSCDGQWIAHAMDQDVCVTNASTGETVRLTQQSNAGQAPSVPSPKDSRAGSLRHPPRPEAFVFSPDGKRIAYVRPVTANGQTWNQIFVCEVSDQ
ncbi:translocation protein TolB [Novipirellula aureliae]|uniref:Translocation protein TolB n=1 Tax=Novipirellula aureliae TaxID=2527966 RepID=A0A5C6DGC7_9BACT|nr:DUF3748 domain-containing protein [Novipirellula aureliae]TWU35702.1 translocation protein TolB [Novipirellula aureliae]